MESPDCFRCRPDAVQPPETAWNWSAPRSLCSSHKRLLRLEDAQLLQDALDRATPDDDELEGSTLGWIYNPVFMDAGAGVAVKGWTDFAAGGMAVFEDRFGARSCFEFRALEAPWAVDLLYAIRLAGPAGAGVATLQALLGAVVAAKAAVPPDLPGRRGLWEGLDDLTRAWNVRLRLDRIRKRVGRLWPQSFGELGSWIDEAFHGVNEIEPGTEASFCHELAALAVRRFPAGAWGSRLQ